MRTVSKQQTCDGSPYYGTSCRNGAAWLIQVGERKMDRQYACASHLNQACMAMMAAEGRAGAVLTLRRV